MNLQTANENDIKLLRNFTLINMIELYLQRDPNHISTINELTELKKALLTFDTNKIETILGSGITQAFIDISNMIHEMSVNELSNHTSSEIKKTIELYNQPGSEIHKYLYRFYEYNENLKKLNSKSNSTTTKIYDDFQSNEEPKSEQLHPSLNTIRQLINASYSYLTKDNFQEFCKHYNAQLIDFAKFKLQDTFKKNISDLSISESINDDLKKIYEISLFFQDGDSKSISEPHTNIPSDYFQYICRSYISINKYQNSERVPEDIPTFIKSIETDYNNIKELNSLHISLQNGKMIFSTNTENTPQKILESDSNELNR